MTATPPLFPSTETFAHGFYVEAIRHLDDARVLYEANRQAAAITSIMKASELGIKAIFILENAVGYYEKVYATHKPLTDVATHPLLNQIPAKIKRCRTNITSEIR